MSEKVKHLRIVVVGDGTVGKTCLAMTYTRNEFPKYYVPTVMEEYSANIQVNEDTVVMSLWDTAGQEEYTRLRLLSYPGTHVIVLCFALDSPSSYENARKLWYPEISHNCRAASIILVGTKSDLRDMSLNTTITHDEGLKLKKEIKAHTYIECSAMNRSNVKEVFDIAVEAFYIQMTNKPRKKQCTLL